MITLGGHASPAVPGASPNWGDVPTWLAAVVAAVALIAAIIAYRKQAESVRQQGTMLELQRQQLKDQQAANARQAEVVAAQLREMQWTAEAYERQQADEVEISPRPSTAAPPGTTLPDKARVHGAGVSNGSRRPITDVVCRIEPVPGEALQEAGMVGRLVEMGMGPASRMLIDQTQDSRVRLIHAGQEWAFNFRYDTASHPDARITARFTDDAGLYWQIDPDQHLSRLESRDW